MNDSLFPSEIIDSVQEFFCETSKWWIHALGCSTETVTQELLRLFSDVNELSELNEQRFWRQINSVRRDFKNDRNLRVTMLRAVVYFYVYIDRVHPEMLLFHDSRTLYPSLLNNRSFIIDWLENKYKFMTFHPGLKYDGHSNRFIFILKGVSHESSRFKNYDYVKVDVSSIDSPFYRKCLFEYACSSINILKGFSITIYAQPLNILAKIKNSKGYHNSSLEHISKSEITTIVNSIENRVKDKREQFHSLASPLRSFLNWASKMNYISADESAFESFRYFTHLPNNTKISRADNELIDKLLNVSMAEANNDPEHYFVMNTVLYLVCQTNIRISSVCGLKRNCIVPQVKPNEYKINYTTKTGAGNKEETTIITNKDKLLLDKAIEFTTPLLSQTSDEMKDFIFLYTPNKRKYVKVVDKFSFNLYLKMLINKYGFPNTVATSLRKAVFSNARQFVEETGKTSIQYQGLTKHAAESTTDRIYAKPTPKEYFETMYLVDLDTISDDIKNRISNNTRTDVPNGLEPVLNLGQTCGRCHSSGGCIASAALPCFVCKEFVTSLEYVPVFEGMVKDVDEQLMNASTPHDREDLLIIKSVLVEYLLEFNKMKNENNHK